MTRPSRLAGRALGAILVALALATLLASPALGATARRTWQAPIASGAATLAIYPSMSGSLAMSVHGLKPSTTYALMIYTGTCASPKPVVKLTGLRTDADGNAARTSSLNTTLGRDIWGTAYNHPIAVRLASGAERHCAALNYPVATRIAIGRYGIDLPILRQNGNAYPLCNVALYSSSLSQPGEAGEGLIFAHARTGMFLPLLTASKINNGAAMVGTSISIWMSNSTVLTYRISRVLRHSYVLPSVSENSEHLYLQTSEGPHGTANKLLIELSRVGSGSATYAASHPTPHPVVCGF